MPSRRTRAPHPSANILCVAVIAPDASLADFSNWGALSVDVGAPGVAIDSTVPEQDLPYREAFLDPLAGRWTAGGGPGAWTREATLPDDPRVVPGDGTGSVLGGPRPDPDERRPHRDRRTPRLHAHRRVGSPPCPTATPCSRWRPRRTGSPSSPSRGSRAVTRYTQRAYNLDDPAEPLWVRLRFATPPTLPQPAGAAPYVDRVAVRCLTGGARLRGQERHVDGDAGGRRDRGARAHRQPGLTAVQARAAIMQSTRALPSLAGKTVTGGLTDLPAALARADAIAAGGGGGRRRRRDDRAADGPRDRPRQPRLARDDAVRRDRRAARGRPPRAGDRQAPERAAAWRLGVGDAGAHRHDHLSGQLRQGDTRVDLPQKARSVTAGREVTLRLKPGPRGRSLLRSARRDGRRVRAALALTFIGADGSRTTVNRGGVYVG